MSDGTTNGKADGNRAESGTNPHVNYEPNSLGGVRQAPAIDVPHTPYVEGRLVRQAIERTNP